MKKPHVTQIGILCALISVVLGCNDSAERYSKKIADLTAQVDSLRSKQEGMFTLVMTMLTQQSTMWNSQIVLDPASKGFQRLDANNGFFLVSIGDVQPYANGYRLTLNIGNPLDMTFDGLTCKMKWGAWRKSESWETWQSQLKAKDIPLVNEIRAGAWNKVEILLVPAGADDLGYIEMQIETDAVRLRNY